MADAPFEVACAARRDYLPHVATMIASLLTNGGSARVHLLVGEEVRAEEAKALGAMATELGGALDLHRIDGAGTARLKTTKTFPASHWYRVLLPEILEDTERVLYLDADTIVLGPISGLFGAQLGSNVLAAVTNPFPDPNTAATLCHGLGVRVDRYFNSGVMVLDLAALRRIDARARVFEFAERNAELLLLPEQDAMNAVLADSRLELPPRWNAMLGVERLPHAEELFGIAAVRDALERPVIRHFEGSGANKPWHPDSPGESQELYASYRRLTPWPDLATTLRPE